jgi:hypothetical protein
MKEERRSDPLAYSPSRWLDPREESPDEEEPTDEEGTSPGSRIDGYLESYFDRLDGLEPL